MDNKKKETKKVEKKIEEVNYTDILTKIFYTLITIAILMGANLFVNIIKSGSVSPDIDEEEVTEQNTDYDVSMFEELTTSELVNSVKNNDTRIVYIGRSTCGYCVKFLPVLRQAQKEFHYTTTYLDFAKMTSEDQTNLLTLDNDSKYISENFGYTPMVLLFKDSKLVNGWVGYSEYNSFAAFLNENGVK